MWPLVGKDLEWTDKLVVLTWRINGKMHDSSLQILHLVCKTTETSTVTKGSYFVKVFFF